MGTWQAGKKMWVGIEDAETTKAIRAAFEAGITTIDTAEVYGRVTLSKLLLKLYPMSETRRFTTKVFANHLHMTK